MSDRKSSGSDKDLDTGSSGGNIGSGVKCGSSGRYTFHGDCHGTLHHYLKGEQGCELFGGRTKD